MKHVPNKIYSKKCQWRKNNSYFKIAVKHKTKISSKYFLLIRKTKMRYATTNTIRLQKPQLNPVTHIIFETSKLICHNILFIIHFLLTSLLYCFFSYDKLIRSTFCYEYIGLSRLYHFKFLKVAFHKYYLVHF